MYKGSCKNSELMHLMHCLSFYVAHSFSFHAVHIAGVDNVAADELSRGDLSTFFSYFPQASPTPASVPPATWLCTPSLIGHLSNGGSCSVLLFTWHSWLYSKTLKVSSIPTHQHLHSVSSATSPLSETVLCSFVSFSGGFRGVSDVSIETTFVLDIKIHNL